MSRGPNLTCRDCDRLEPEARAGDRCADCGTVLVPAKVLKKFPKDPLLGRVVSDKYAVVSVLGVGGFGAVYRAVQEPVGRHVALKVVHAQHVEDADMRARFFREAKVVARLNDPAVVTLYDYGDEPSTGLYMVFELVAGRNLGQIIREGPQDPVWVAHVLLQVLRALSEAHDLGMIHRDIKPANIMVVESQGRETVRVLDFGIAKVERKEDGEASLQTREGMMLGTPQYMSPEQARASAHLDGRSDLYSLAVVGMALLEGKNVFERPSVVETIMAHVSEPPPSLTADLHVPDAFEAVLRRGLEKDHEARFASAGEMAAAIVAAFPNVAFPSLTYEFRAPTMRPGQSLLGAAMDGQTTPTPSMPAPALRSGGSIESTTPVATMAEPGPSGDLAAAMPGPDVLTSADSVHAPTTERRSNSTPMLLLGLVLLLAAGGVVAALTMGGQGPVEAAPVAATVTLPKDPVARAELLVAQGKVDAAERTLSEAIAGVEGPARVEIYRRAKARAALAPVLARPVLEALAPREAPAPPPSTPALTKPAPNTPPANTVAPAPPPPPAKVAPKPRPRRSPPKEAPKKLDVPEF